jgi:hypothetical protein
MAGADRIPESLSQIAESREQEFAEERAGCGC